MSLQKAAMLAVALGCTGLHGQTFTQLKSFTSTDGASPYGQMVLAGANLYGTTCFGGSNNAGTIFKIGTNGANFAVLKHLGSPGPAAPRGRLTLVGTTLYGTSQGGGSAGNGTVFKINEDGSGFAVVKNFNGADGAGPQAGLTPLGNVLYGTTYYGGTWDNGTVFKMNLDGTGYTVLHHFNLDGVNPAGEMALANAVLYGTTYNGGMNGSIFKIKTDGSSYTVLKSLSMTNGTHPCAGVIIGGTSLYGAAYQGGVIGKAMACGTLFKIGMDGTGYQVLHTFDYTNGSGPYSTLNLVGNTLYGTTELGGGGLLGVGTVFKMNTDGSGFTVLKAFTGMEGSRPYAGVRLDGSTLYGTCYGGGSKLSGIIYSLNTAAILPTPPTITSQPQSQTNQEGQSVTFQVSAAGSAPLVYQWRKDPLQLNNAGNIAGANSNVLALANLQISDAGDYSVIVTNAAGAITSSVAKLTVTAKPAPIAGTDTVEVPLGLTLSIPVSTLLANDSDPQKGVLGIRAVQSPSNLGTIVQLVNQTITYWGGYNGPLDQFTYTLTNANGGSATGTVNVKLTGCLPATNQMVIQPLAGGSLRLIVGGHLTSPYALEQASSLNPPIPWQILETNWAGARGYTFFTNTPPPGAPTFYRTRQLW